MIGRVGHIVKIRLVIEKSLGKENGTAQKSSQVGESRFDLVKRTREPRTYSEEKQFEGCDVPCAEQMTGKGAWG